MSVHWSKFNIAIDRTQGDRAIFNTASGKIVSLPATDVAHLNEASVRRLLAAGILASDDSCEVKRLLAGAQSYQNDRAPTFALALAPTMQCNAACVYCYQKDAGKAERLPLSPSDVLTFIAKQMEDRTTLSICWYGGEPLLSLAWIRAFSHEVKSQFPQIRLRASIITNGTLLTRDTAQILRNECAVEEMQVTLDGGSKMHNQQRPMKDRSDGFARIVENIESCSDLIPTTIRVNISPRNKEALTEVVNYLHDIRQWPRERIFVYPALVTEGIFGCGHTCGTVNDNEFAHLWLESFKSVRGKISRHALRNWLPTPKPSACGAQNTNAWVVGPDGSLFRCWESMGRPEEKRGNLQTLSAHDQCSLPAGDAFLPEECQQCRLLPACLGGCPRERAKSGKARCLPQRFILEPLLTEYLDEVSLR